MHDPFGGQRDDGGISVQQFYASSSRPGSISMPAYKSVSTSPLDDPALSSWHYQQDPNHFYSHYLTPSSSSGSSPQFGQSPAFVKPEPHDALSTWYDYPATAALDIPASAAPTNPQMRAPPAQRMEHSSSQQSWHSHPSATHYAPASQAQSLWESQNVMLHAGPQYHSR